MSVARPARCLLSGAPRMPKSALRCLRQFHNTASCNARRRPHYPSIKAADLKILNDEALEAFPAYSSVEEELLSRKYTPGQLAAIKAAEAAVDPKDLNLQSIPRDDPWRLEYEDDDLSKIDPVLDKQPKKGLDPAVPYHSLRPKTENELMAAFANFIVTAGEKYAGSVNSWNDRLEGEFEVDMTKFLDNPRTFMHADSEKVFQALEDPAYSALAPELPRIDSPAVRAAAQQGEEEDPHMVRLIKQMGWDKKRILRMRTKNLLSHFVVNQTRMGKVRSMYYLTIAGNQNGLLGVGEGKSTEPEDARRQALMAAIRNMKPIHRYEGRTIYGDVRGKVGGVELTLSARPPGFGNRCQHLIFEMARAAGIQDLSARVHRSRNKMNVVKATWQALLSQKLPEDIARARGRKLVDVRRVYYGGPVY